MVRDPKKAYKVSKYTAKLFSRTEKYAANVEKLFSVAVNELLKMTAGSELGEDGTFSFGGNKRLSSKANKVLRGLYSSVYNEIKGDVSAEWEYANLSCDELIESIYGEGLDEDNHFARWFTRNKEAVDAFFKRKSEYGGLNLSQDVWKYVDNLKTEMEVALSVSLGQGDSASTVSRKVRKYLNNPDDMFRRFRVKVGEDEDGNPVYGRKWKRKYIDPQGKVAWKDFNPKNYHTGRGVYRSSYKNAMRLTRTETNMAYRSAEQDRWQNMDFVLGYRVKRSRNHPDVDICDDLSADNDDNESNHGVYPKTFVFKGWHPQCRCFVVPILASRADFIKMQKAILNGEEPPQPGGKIEEPNEYFNKWVEKNQERIEKANALPYWVKDNKKAVEKAITSADDGDKEDGLKALAKAIGIEVGSPMAHEQADMKHPNPHYQEDEQYRINCQSCVVAYELRRRGLPVETFGNIKGSMGGTLAHNTRAAWLDADGKIPEPIVCKQMVTGRIIDRRGYVRSTYTSVDDVWKDFIKQTSEEGRYHISWNWAGKEKGHIITMETFADGTRRFYDPQTGIEAKGIFPWAGKNLSKFDLRTRGLCAYRVDNLQPNTLIVKGVVKKAGSTLGTPMMTSGQGAWWIKNAQGATSFMGEFEPYSTEIIKRLKECKTKVQRNNLLENVARRKEAEVINDNGKAFTTCYPGHRSMKGETWKNTKQIAIDLNNRGMSVCFLPEYKDKISADAIVKVAGSWRLADFKCSQSVKSNTIATDIEHAFEQADSCVIKVLKADKGIICDMLSYFERNEIKTGNLIVVNKYGKHLIIKPSDIANGKYRYSLKGFF